MKTKQEQIEKIMCMFNKLKRGDYCADNCYECKFIETTIDELLEVEQ